MSSYQQKLRASLLSFLCICMLCVACSEEPKNLEKEESVTTVESNRQDTVENKQSIDTNNKKNQYAPTIHPSAEKTTSHLLEGHWRLSDIVNLYQDTSKLQQDRLANQNAHLSIIDNEFTFVYYGTPRAKNIHCTLDSIQRIARKDYGPKDINSHLKATSYWYGYRRDRGDSVISFGFFCPDGQFNFEYFDKDTLGYFDNRQLFVFTR